MIHRAYRSLVWLCILTYPVTAPASPGEMRPRQPWGLVVLPDGRRIVRDAAGCSIQIQDRSGRVLGVVSDRLIGTYDIALDARRRIWSVGMGDGSDPRPALRLNMLLDGRLLHDYRVKEGDRPGELRRPMGITVGPGGYLFIADTGNDRLQVFTPQGRPVRVIGASDLREPMKVAFDRDGRLYVADAGHNRVAIFTRRLDGSYTFTKALTGIKEPVCVAVDSRGRVFVSANREAGVHMFDVAGKHTWKYEGAPGAPLSGPRGLAFDRQDRLLIVDEATRRIIAVKPPRP